MPQPELPMGPPKGPTHPIDQQYIVAGKKGLTKAREALAEAAKEVKIIDLNKPREEE